MKKAFISVAIIAGVLAGCNNADTSKNDDTSKNASQSAIEVKVDIQTPVHVKAKKDIELVAHVTQADKAVDDADEVKFEVWESGHRDKSEILMGELDKDGVYKATTKFSHDGVYYMYAHTTARGLHVMPKKKITVGKPDLSKVKEDKDDGKMDMNMMDMDHSKKDEDDH